MKSQSLDNSGRAGRSAVRNGVLALVLLAMPLSLASAQNAEDHIAGMRRSVEVFSGVLRESLGLNVRQGIFSPRNGEVKGRYLLGQGIVLELVTPMQNNRAWPGVDMQSLNQSLEQLSGQLDSMMERGLVTRPDLDAVRDAMALSLRTDDVARFYREQLQMLSTLGDLPSIERTMSAAASTLQRLQEAGQLDESTIENLTSQFQALQGQLAMQIRETDQLRAEMRELAAEAQALPDEQTLDRWLTAKAQIEEQLTSLGERLNSQVSTLREQQQRARELQQVQREQDLAHFESQMFATVCDYAAGLRALPEDEHLTLVMVGVGELTENGNRQDRIHVIPQQSVAQCLRGEISGVSLAESVVTYSY